MLKHKRPAHEEKINEEGDQIVEINAEIYSREKDED